MNSLIKPAFIGLAAFSLSAYSHNEQLNDINPIIFNIVGNDAVVVNGVKTSIRGSWSEAVYHINPDENNYYKITNVNNFSKQASDIQEYMTTVAKISGIKVELVK